MILKDVCEKMFSGQVISRFQAKEELGDIIVEKRKIIIPKAIGNGHIIQEELVEENFKKEIDEEKLTKEYDLVIKLSTPYDTALISKEDEGLVVTSFGVVLRGLDRNIVDPLFLTAYLNTDQVKQGLKMMAKGLTIPLIKLGDIQNIQLPKIDIKTQQVLGQAYSISSQKMVLLKKMVDNEAEFIDGLITKVIRGGSRL